jgi:indole-3-acetate monooxygenase
MVMSASSVPQVAQELFSVLDGHADWGEANGRLHDDVLEAFHQHNLFGMWVPNVLGGLELEPSASVEVIEALSYAEPSAGWVQMATALTAGAAGAYLADEAAEGLFDGRRMPVIAGQGTRPGAATPIEGGFRVTGSWQFASGLLHASHVHSLVVVEGTGEPLVCVVPIGKAQFRDNWDVMGLRATGSIDYEMDGVVVPETFAHPAGIDAPRRGGSIYRYGIIGFALMGHTGWALGCGRRLLDELTNAVRAGTGRVGAEAVSDGFLGQFAEAEMRLRSARALAFDVWRKAQETVERRGDELSFEQKTLLRLALMNATRSAREVASFVYVAGGTTSLRAGTIQKLFRDVQAGAQHVTSGPGAVRNAGRALAGLAADRDWMFVDLVP